MDAGGTGDCLAQPTLVEMGWGIARGRDGGWTAVVEWGSETRHRTDAWRFHLQLAAWLS